ncbi:hypothetical protein BDB00DRAFT_807868 [Zychaea mexicana]|uniref:uncharacterized protein n=1 Tax=Zychaea mexicana TaxID=64656 RepID=UPI0022FE02E1|nr:uncharacterized protein BDB00DRAFT_807868 [Zychaea mexicana]KAI9496567.1 hypothetical protein BDB00DRAFT_807868 [Zychaea mexicana]
MFLQALKRSTAKNTATGNTRPSYQLASRRRTAAAAAAGCYFNQSKRTMSAFSNMADNDPDTLETEKSKVHTKKDWNGKLASYSEAVIKAEQDDDHAIDKLQEESVQVLVHGKDGQGILYHNNTSTTTSCYTTVHDNNNKQ